MSSDAGPSSLRSRRAAPPSLPRPQPDDDEGEEDRREPQPGSAGTTSSTGVHFPGGLPLPAVKGTIGGIESPRRYAHGHTSSISSSATIQNDPLTPLTAQTFQSSSTGSYAYTTATSSTNATFRASQVEPYHAALENAIAKIDADAERQARQASGSRGMAVFRADPTVKSCLAELKLESRGEITRLFGVVG